MMGGGQQQQEVGGAGEQSQKQQQESQQQAQLLLLQTLDVGRGGGPDIRNTPNIPNITNIPNIPDKPTKSLALPDPDSSSSNPSPPTVTAADEGGMPGSQASTNSPHREQNEEGGGGEKQIGQEETGSINTSIQNPHVLNTRPAAAPPAAGEGGEDDSTTMLAGWVSEENNPNDNHPLDYRPLPVASAAAAAATASASAASSHPLRPSTAGDIPSTPSGRVKEKGLGTGSPSVPSHILRSSPRASPREEYAAQKRNGALVARVTKANTWANSRPSTTRSSIGSSSSSNNNNNNNNSATNSSRGESPGWAGYGEVGMDTTTGLTQIPPSSLSRPLGARSERGGRGYNKSWVSPFRARRVRHLPRKAGRPASAGVVAASHITRFTTGTGEEHGGSTTGGGAGGGEDCAAAASPLLPPPRPHTSSGTRTDMGRGRRGGGRQAPRQARGGSREGRGGGGGHRVLGEWETIPPSPIPGVTAGAAAAALVSATASAAVAAPEASPGAHFDKNTPVVVVAKPGEDTTHTSFRRFTPTVNAGIRTQANSRHDW